MTDQTPPTDRPLTAGDVPLLREGDVLRVVEAGSFLLGRGLVDGGPAIVRSVDPPYVDVYGPKERSHNRPSRFTFVSRPATSAASEVEGLDLYDDKVQAGIAWTLRQVGEALGLTTWTQGDGSESVEGDVGAEIHTILVDAGLRDPETNEMAALASPPVSERERELEGALEWALDQAGSEHPHYPERGDNGGWQFPYLVHGSPMGGGVGHARYETALRAVQAARTWPGNEADAHSGQYTTAQPAGEGK